jgi:hypothetical protein
MRSCIAVDFHPTKGVVSEFIDTTGSEGFTIVTMRLIPSTDAERSTFIMNIEGDDFSSVMRLEVSLRALTATIDVIHCARSSNPSVAGLNKDADFF